MVLKKCYEKKTQVNIKGHVRSNIKKKESIGCTQYREIERVAKDRESIKLVPELITE